MNYFTITYSCLLPEKKVVYDIKAITFLPTHWKYAENISSSFSSIFGSSVYKNIILQIPWPKVLKSLIIISKT